MATVRKFPVRSSSRSARRTAPRTRPGTAPDVAKPLVGLIMGSKSDWETMSAAAEVLAELEIPFEARVISAHRTPRVAFEYASSAEGRGLEVIVAGAGGAAHLAGVVAALTVLPVLGVPVAATSLNGLDSLLSIVQMPKGVPVGTLAVGKSGAANAGLFAAAILALRRPDLRERLRAWRERRTAEAAQQQLP